MACRSQRARRLWSRATSEESHTYAPGKRFPARRKPKPERQASGNRVALETQGENVMPNFSWQVVTGLAVLGSMFPLAPLAQVFLQPRPHEALIAYRLRGNRRRD